MFMRRIIIVALIFMQSQLSFGQWKQTSIAMPSANVASLGTYGELPVSHFTGVPDISIPLYTLKGNRLELPVSVSYHPALRPDQHPGWVGLGWSLFAGGSITRKAYGYIDEYQHSSYGNIGFYYKYNIINFDNWAAPATLSNTSSYDLADEDVTADEFTFSFLGYSGKFFLDHTGQWRVQCDKELKVVFNPADITYPFIYNTGYSNLSIDILPRAFKKFILIDGNGTKYTFGGVENAIEYSDEMTPNLAQRGEYFYANSWFLTKIESADGAEVINLNYVRGPFTSYLYKGYNSMYLNASHGGYLAPACGFWSASTKRNGRIVSPVYLTSIEMPSRHLRIDFTASKCNDLVYADADYTGVIADIYGGPAMEDFALVDYVTGLAFDVPGDATITPKYKRFIWRKLDAINVVQTSTSTTLRKINFTYLEQNTRRLRLTSLVAKDKDNATVNTFSFSYNDNNLLPAYLTQINDHWGFNNNTVFPFDIATTDFMVARAPLELYTKAEVLTSMTFPTGGVSSFEWEINKYSNYVHADRTSVVPENGTAGGLRIKKITNTDNSVPTRVSEFFYVKNYTAGADPLLLTSSGVLDNKPKYTFMNTNGIDNSGIPFTYHFVSSNPVVPLSINSSGTHIGYSEVVELRSDKSYTIHKFTNHDNGHLDAAPAGTFNRNAVAWYPASSRYFERGRPSIMTQYTDDGKAVLEQVNVYSRINESQKAARSVDNHSMGVCANDGGRAAVSRSAFYNYYYPFVLTKQTTREFNPALSPATAGVTEKSFVYNDNKTLKRETSHASNGQVIVTNYKYPPDFPLVTVLANMTTANMVALPVEMSKTKNGIPVSVNRANYFSPHTGIFVPQNFEEQVANNPFEIRRQFHQYDNKGNVQDESEAGNVRNVCLWGYNSQHIVAKITGSTYASVQTAMTAAGITQTALDNAASSTDAAMRTLLNGLRTQLPNAFITTYTHAPGIGLTSETDARNKTTFYEYDAFQRLVLIKDQDGNVKRTHKYNYKQ